MKQALFILLTSFFMANYSDAQSAKTFEVSQLIAGGGRNFQIIGTGSHAFTDSLFAEFPKTKRRGYIWKFKNVEIPGIDEPLTLQVHQGIKGYDEKQSCDTSTCSGRSYFHTFTSEKYKKTLLDRQTSLEHPAVIIYVRRGRASALTTKEEAQIVEAYLRSIFES